jgi:hypothetical protein
MMMTMTVMRPRHTIRIHPYAMDMFANEVDVNDRYESVTIPDVHLVRQR